MSTIVPVWSLLFPDLFILFILLSLIVPVQSLATGPAVKGGWRASFQGVGYSACGGEHRFQGRADLITDPIVEEAYTNPSQVMTTQPVLEGDG